MKYITGLEFEHEGKQAIYDVEEKVFFFGEKDELIDSFDWRDDRWTEAFKNKEFSALVDELESKAEVADQGIETFRLNAWQMCEL